MQGGNWDHELWGGQYPDRSWIDEVVNDRPVFLDRLDGFLFAIVLTWLSFLLGWR